MFVKEWLSLKLFDPIKLDNNQLSDREKVFIGVELDNGVTFRETYWTEKNVFKLGANGSSKLQEIVKTELAKVKK